MAAYHSAVDGEAVQQICYLRAENINPDEPSLGRRRSNKSSNVKEFLCTVPLRYLTLERKDIAGNRQSMIWSIW